MLATALALLASLLWGTADFGNGLLSRRMPFWGVVLVSMTTMAASMLVVMLVLRRPAPPVSTLAVLAAGGVLMASSVFTFLCAVTLTRMSVTAAILAGAAVVPVAWGIGHGERPGPVQAAGIVVTLAGIVVISLAERGWHGQAARTTLRGVLLAVASALCVGFGVVALSSGATRDPLWAVAGVRWAAALWAVAILVVVRPPLHVERRLLPLLVLFGLLGMGANLAFAEASALADLSIVAVLGWLGPAVIILWAGLFLRERLRTVQWLAAAAVIAGVVLLSAG